MCLEVQQCSDFLHYDISDFKNMCKIIFANATALMLLVSWCLRYIQLILLYLYVAQFRAKYTLILLEKLYIHKLQSTFHMIEPNYKYLGKYSWSKIDFRNFLLHRNF